MFFQSYRSTIETSGGLGAKGLNRVLLFLSLTVCAASLVCAQGSGNVPLAEMGTSTNADPDWPFAVTRIVSGKVLWIMRNDDATLIVVEDSRGRRGVFTVSPKTRLKADKKSEVASKKHISSQDLTVGQSVTVTFTPDTGKVLALRFLGKAASSGAESTKS